MLAGIRNTIASVLGRAPNKQDTPSSPGESVPQVPGNTDEIQPAQVPTGPPQPGGIQRTEPGEDGREEIPDFADAGAMRLADPDGGDIIEDPGGGGELAAIPPATPPGVPIPYPNTVVAPDGDFGAGAIVTQPVTMAADEADAAFGAGEVVARFEGPPEGEQVPEAANDLEPTSVEPQTLVFGDGEDSADLGDGGEFVDRFDVDGLAEVAVVEDPDLGGEIA